MKPIGLDAGHGGDDFGALSPGGHVTESMLNRAVAHAAKRKAPDLFELIRLDDEHLTWRERNDRAVALGHDLVIAIHHDSLPANPRARGLCAYHGVDNDRTRDLARYAVNNAPSELLLGGRVICAHDDQSRVGDEWLQRPERVINAYTADVLLLELGYLTNRANLEFVRSTVGIEANADTLIAVALRWVKLHREVWTSW